MNCGNDSVMHSAAATEREREREEGRRRAILPAAASGGKVGAGCVAPALNLEPKLAYFTPR